MNLKFLEGFIKRAQEEYNLTEGQALDVLKQADISDFALPVGLGLGGAGAGYLLSDKKNKARNAALLGTLGAGAGSIPWLMRQVGSSEMPVQNPSERPGSYNLDPNVSETVSSTATAPGTSSFKLEPNTAEPLVTPSYLSRPPSVPAVTTPDLSAANTDYDAALKEIANNPNAAAGYDKLTAADSLLRLLGKVDFSTPEK